MSQWASKFTSNQDDGLDFNLKNTIWGETINFHLQSPFSNVFMGGCTCLRVQEVLCKVGLQL